MNCGPKVAFWTAQPSGTGVVVTVLLHGLTQVEIRLFSWDGQKLADKQGAIPTGSSSVSVLIAEPAARVSKVLILAGGEQYALCYAQRRTA